MPDLPVDRTSPLSRSSPWPAIRTARALNAVVGVAVGCFLPFQAAWFISKGFTPGELGLAFAAISVGVTVGVPAWGRVADLRLGSSRALLAGIGLGLVALAAAFASHDRLIAGTAVVISAISMAATAPLTDAIAIRILPDARAQLGRVGLFGSATFGLTALIAGTVYARYGYEFALIPLAAAGIILAAILMRLDVSIATPTVHAAGARRDGTVVSRRAVGLILLAIAIAHTGIEAGYTFIGPRLLDLGAGVETIGLAQSLSIVGEIIGLSVSTWAIRRLGVGIVFGLAVLSYGACMVAWGIATSPGLIVVSRVVSGAALALMLLTATLAITGLFSSARQGTAQSLNQAAAFGLGATIGALSGGVLYGTAEATTMYVIFAVVAAVGAFVGMIAMSELRIERAAFREPTRDDTAIESGSEVLPARSLLDER